MSTNVIRPSNTIPVASTIASPLTLGGEVDVSSVVTAMVDPALEISAGRVQGVFCVNKFGRSTNVDNGVATDIWDLTTQPVWLAPTASRLHTLVSSSASDDGAPLGVGAQVVRIFGLKSWDTAETTEDIVLNGITGVSTLNPYVIIHRMIVMANGATSTNVGTLTATAAVDATVTAQINPGQGQTQMAIYGVPSSQSLYMYSFFVSVNKSGGATGAIDLSMRINSHPDIEATQFVVKHTEGLQSTGSSHMQHRYWLYPKYPGPLILKMAAAGSANDLDVSAGFTALLEDN